MSDGLGGFGGDAAASDPDGGSTDDSGLSDYDPPDPDPPSGGSSGGSSSGGSSSRDRDDDDPPDGYFNDAPANTADGGSTDAGGVGGGTRGPRGAYGDAAAGTADPVTVGVGSGPAPSSIESGFDRETVQNLATGFRENIAAPIGDAARFASPATELDRVIPGEPVGRTVELGTEGAVDVLNPAAAADSTISIVERAASDTQRVAEQGAAGRRQNRQELAEDVAQGGANFIGAVRADPVGTLSRTGGSLVGGAVVGTGITRGARGATRSESSGSGSASGSASGSRFESVASAVDFEDFRSDTRALTGGGRRRSDADQEIEQETIEVERMADEDVVDDTTRELEDIPGVSVQNRDTTSQRTRDAVTDERTVEELEQDIFDSLDDDLLDDTQATTRSDVDAATSGGVSPFAVGAAAVASRDAVGVVGSETDPDALVGAEGFYGDAAAADGMVDGGADTAADTGVGTVQEPVLEQTLIQERAAVEDMATPGTTTVAIGDTTGETIGVTDEPLQPATPGLPQASTPTSRTPRPNPLDETGADEEMRRRPLDVDSADFLNPTIGLDAASEKIVEGLDDVGDIDAGP